MDSIVEPLHHVSTAREGSDMEHELISRGNASDIVSHLKPDGLADMQPDELQ